VHFCILNMHPNPTLTCLHPLAVVEQLTIAACLNVCSITSLPLHLHRPLSLIPLACRLSSPHCSTSSHCQCHPNLTCINLNPCLLMPPPHLLISLIFSVFHPCHQWIRPILHIVKLSCSPHTKCPQPKTHGSPMSHQPMSRHQWALVHIVHMLCRPLRSGLVRRIRKDSG